MRRTCGAAQNDGDVTELRTMSSTTVITTDLSYLHWRLYQACDQHRQLRLAALLDTAA